MKCFAVIKLDELLASVTVRSTKCDLEDWDLDKGAEFSNTGVGSRNSVTALSLTAILEVFVTLKSHIYFFRSQVVALVIYKSCDGNDFLLFAQDCPTIFFVPGAAGK